MSTNRIVLGALSLALAGLACDATDDPTPAGTTSAGSSGTANDSNTTTQGAAETGPLTAGTTTADTGAETSADDTTGPGPATGTTGATTGGATTGGVTSTWSSFAEGFFADYCVSCHSPAGQAMADFGQYNIVAMRLNAIKCGVAPILLEGCEGEHPPGWFPVGNGPSPTEDERWLLVDWIEAGAPAR